MTIRRANEADRELLRELWSELTAERPPPAYAHVSWDDVWAELRGPIAAGAAFVVEEPEGVPAGYAFGASKGPLLEDLGDLYVRQSARRRGLAHDLVAAVARAARGRGASHLSVTVDASNAGARALYAELGFTDESLHLAVELDVLEQRVGHAEPAPSYGSIHVRSDDVAAVERGVRQFVPRLRAVVRGGSRETVVVPSRGGWIGVYDELCDREPELLRRLARELSERMGSVVLSLGVERGLVVRYFLFDRGGVVDEYLSVPEFYGPLPPGDVVALGANPTMAARLAGTDRERLRAVARTASSPGELPPASELLAELATLFGVEGAGRGFAGGAELQGAIAIPHE